MDCAECREIISAAMDGEARPAETAQAEAHLASCGACKEIADRLAQLDRLARVHEVQAEDDEKLLAAYDAVIGPAHEQEAGLPSPAPSLACHDDSSGHLHLVGAAACGCASHCGCGCQQGEACRCSTQVA